MELYGVQQLIANSKFLGYAAALADGESAYLLWIIGIFSLLVWAISFRNKVWETRWYRLLRSAALLALPVLLLIGMVVSMIPPA